MTAPALRLVPAPRQLELSEQAVTRHLDSRASEERRTVALAYARGFVVGLFVLAVLVAASLIWGRT